MDQRAFFPAGSLQSRPVVRAANVSLLRNLEVDPPVYTPPTAGCQTTLMVKSFGNSYGNPFVGDYTPPACDFNRVTMNFTVTSSGRQFDRLALMYLDDTEVWRTSTSEPTTNGIIWTYVKDMTSFLPIWKQPAKLIFDLGNIIDDTYTGPFNTTLTATFFTEEGGDPPADLIIPISARRSPTNGASAFVVPEMEARDTLVLPRNMKRAVFTISACGQATEEFWWSNVLSSNTDTFGPNATLYGYSPWRELQLLIDGQMAGMAWPFPVIFTGGIVPGFWRPIAGIDTYDLKEDEIDITAWLPLLSDGKEHEFEILVAGLNDNGKGQAEITTTVGDNWVVTGKIFAWLDEPGSITTGEMGAKEFPPPTFSASQVTGGLNQTVNETLRYQVLAQRSLSVTSKVKTSEGEKEVSWSQTASYSNIGNFTNLGNSQVTDQTTSGADVSSLGYSRRYTYPIRVLNAFDDQTASGGNMTINGTIDRSKDLQVIGNSVIYKPLSTFPSDGPGAVNQAILAGYKGYSIKDRQNASATFFTWPKAKQSFSSGSTWQTLVFGGLEIDGDGIGAKTVPVVKKDAQLYTRSIKSNNSTVVQDFEQPAFLGAKAAVGLARVADADEFEFLGVQDVLNRGPGFRNRATSFPPFDPDAKKLRKRGIGA
ncbi:hypothetical protein K402DRAFT_329612 [Aulographum hederae CBS 113979]|uniref:Peptide N-acetyl-beta-D-glucosaminyl asparaginase amidase A N-terminal domain-containing protein n=1 Tax=Aulographum hederae CBS 113979 TaxID=1176131 RepID=A0A6G1H482_9PEZI|nr:hypothetical protein K402DRAFT_329612 [Aulographum hederae CBS 113979]